MENRGGPTVNSQQVNFAKKPHLEKKKNKQIPHSPVECLVKSARDTKMPHLHRLQECVSSHVMIPRQTARHEKQESPHSLSA